MFQKMLQSGGGSGNVKDIKWILKDGELESGYSFRQMNNNIAQITKENGYYKIGLHQYGSGAGIDVINSGYKYVFVDVLRQNMSGSDCYFGINGYNTEEKITLPINQRCIIGYDISNLNNITPNIFGWGNNYNVYLYNLWLEK